jgi:hypothetical protein
VHRLRENFSRGYPKPYCSSPVSCRSSRAQGGWVSPLGGPSQPISLAGHGLPRRVTRR